MHCAGSCPPESSVHIPTQSPVSAILVSTLSPTSNLLKCNWDESLLQIIVRTDNNPGEISWELYDNKSLIDSFGSFTLPNSISTHNLCVIAGSCYKFILKDDGGDGIKNGGFVKINESGVTVLDVTEFSSSVKEYSIPVEGTRKYKIGWTSRARKQCKWLRRQGKWKQNQECSKPYIKASCANSCNSCVL